MSEVGKQSSKPASSIELLKYCMLSLAITDSDASNEIEISDHLILLEMFQSRCLFYVSRKYIFDVEHFRCYLGTNDLTYNQSRSWAILLPQSNRTFRNKSRSRILPLDLA